MNQNSIISISEALVRENLSDKQKSSLKRLLEINKELQARKVENLYETYIPNVKAEEFIKTVGNKKYISLFLAANGVGKSCSLVNILTNICYGAVDFKQGRSRWSPTWGIAPSTWFNYPLFKEYPYKNKRIRIASDPTTIREKIVPEIKKWFPSNRYETQYETSKEGKAYESKFLTSTGFVIDLLTYEQDVKEYESVDCDIIIFDEPPPRAIFMASVARLRTGGQIIMGMTPLTYSAWVKDDLYDMQEEKGVGVIEADVWANCEDLPGTRGMLKRVDIDNMVKQYPEDEKLARIEGKFGHLIGRVHKDFTEKIHVVSPFKMRREDYIVVMSHDTHPRTPDAIVWVAIDRKGTHFQVDEMWIDGTDEEMAREIRMRETGWRIERRLLDPSGFNRDNRTDIDDFAARMGKLGLYYEPGSKDLVGCIRKTDEMLAYEDKGGVLVAPPQLYLCSNNKRTIKEFNNYVWDDYRGKMKDERDPKPRPKDINDHFLEALHRILIGDFRWYPPAPETDITKSKFDPYRII